MKEIKSKAELMRILAGLELADVGADDELGVSRRNSVVCSLIGHSRIQSFCFGYWNCGRCGHQVGDSLGSVYPAAEKAVVIGHDCEVCRENYESCTWRDKLYAPDPFAKELEHEVDV